MTETIVIPEFNFQKMVAASDGLVTSLYVNHERLQLSKGSNLKRILQI